MFSVSTLDELNALPDWTIIAWDGRIGRTQANTISSLDGGPIVYDKSEVLPAMVFDPFGRLEH